MAYYTKATSKFEVYVDTRGEYRARFVASNGRIVFWTEGYVRKQGALEAIALIKREAPGARVVDLT